MKILCVDDEALVLQLTLSMCRELPQVDEAEGFSYVQDALDWLDTNAPDAALLDIDMPEMNGLQLAAKIKEKRPDTAIIFLTGFSQYAVDAFAMHASGYLLKPLDKDRLIEELNYAGSRHEAEKTDHIMAVTFGNFDLFVDGQAVQFSRSKAKELLAYLIDRQGSNVTRAEAFSALWEDTFYDRSMQKQFDVILRSLRMALDDAGIPEILEMQRGYLRVRPELIRCDLYRFMAGDIDAVNSYRGEYMNNYAWAELTEAYMDRRVRENSSAPEYW